MGDMAQGAVQEYPYIFRLDVDARSMAPIGQLAMARIRPQVSYGNGTFVVSGGIGVSMAVQMGGLAGAEMVTWGTDQDGPALLGSSLDLAQFSTQTGQLYDANTADTYELGLDGSLSAYGKRASEQTLLAPAATAYDGWFYVLAASENEPYRVFSATRVDTAPQPGDYVAPEPDPDPDPEPDPEGENEDQSLRKLATTGDPNGTAWALGAIGVAGGAVALVAARRRVR